MRHEDEHVINGSQKSLADMLFAGEGIKPNQANAIQGWKIAAQNGIVPAFLNLGWCDCLLSGFPLP